MEFNYKESTKDTGVVITDGESEFVWVSVPEIGEMAVLQTGKYDSNWGTVPSYLGYSQSAGALDYYCSRPIIYLK